jgi:hypothetical protein
MSSTVAGQGRAGIPAGGVHSVQGVVGGTPVPVSGGGVANPSTAVVTQVPQSAVAVTLRIANAARVSITIFNDAPQVLFVKEGAAASAVDFTARLTQNSSYVTNYTGLVTGIWNAGGPGQAQVTERTP